MIRLELVPAKIAGRYIVMLDGRLLCTSSTPIFSAARMLARAELDPDTVLEVTAQGSGVVSMRTTIGEAAQESPAVAAGRPQERAQPAERAQMGSQA